ncbi:MAG: hypothetical protein ACK57G_08340, partial [Planctomycetota bacterium]
MRDWLAEAVAYFSEEKQKSKTAQISTDKTDKTPFRIVSSVLSVPLEAVSEKTLSPILHPEDARDLSEAVFYLRGATKEEAIEAGKVAARDPSKVPLSDYEATLDECGLTYWWCGDRYHVQGGYIR